MSDECTTPECRPSGGNSIVGVLVIGSLLFLILVWVTGIKLERRGWKHKLITSGRCEYRADAKTGVTRLVWVDDGTPVEKE